MKAMVQSVGLLLLLAGVTAGIGTAQTPDAAVQVTSLSVDRLSEGVTVRIKTSGHDVDSSAIVTAPVFCA